MSDTSTAPLSVPRAADAVVRAFGPDREPVVGRRWFDIWSDGLRGLRVLIGAAESRGRPRDVRALEDLLNAITDENAEGPADPDVWERLWAPACEAVRDLANKSERKRGAPGYPEEILRYALELREKHPEMKVFAIRSACLKKFSHHEMPDVESFRRWLNSDRARRLAGTPGE